MPLWLSRLVAVLTPAHDDRTDALRGDMVRLAALAEEEHQRGADREAAGPQVGPVLPKLTGSAKRAVPGRWPSRLD